MYVKRDSGEVSFRLWNQDDPKMWEEHGWVPHEAILAAGKLYDGKKFNPNDAYDIGLATALIEKEG